MHNSPFIYKLPRTSKGGTCCKPACKSFVPDPWGISILMRSFQISINADTMFFGIESD